jgi:hypothetical protein
MGINKDRGVAGRKEGRKKQLGEGIVGETYCSFICEM